ncbi:Hypothetical predicted protein [Mytilus galloprovincialis]|uniref:Uncharacterized protein n=1 Tax=Mytilus galloprovincialis TaxID=29158 RepID=A0A8B6DBN4_MYTGA|nr:Hypothetical predicted protein [Mytilus galloprovincialis]
MAHSMSVSFRESIKQSRAKSSLTSVGADGYANLTGRFMSWPNTVYGTVWNECPSLARGPGVWNGSQVKDRCHCWRDDLWGKRVPGATHGPEMTNQHYDRDVIRRTVKARFFHGERRINTRERVLKEVGEIFDISELHAIYKCGEGHEWYLKFRNETIPGKIGHGNAVDGIEGMKIRFDRLDKRKVKFGCIGSQCT